MKATISYELNSRLFIEELHACFLLANLDTFAHFLCSLISSKCFNNFVLHLYLKVQFWWFKFYLLKLKYTTKY